MLNDMIVVLIHKKLSEEDKHTNFHIKSIAQYIFHKYTTSQPEQISLLSVQENWQIGIANGKGERRNIYYIEGKHFFPSPYN